MLDLLADFIGSLFADVFRRSRTDRLVRKGSLECGLRVIAGSVPGLSGRWRHGKALLAPGVVRSGTAVVPVVSVSTDRLRQPTGREAWSVNPDCRIVEIDTGSAIVEWAVPTHHLDWAMRQV